MESTNVISTKSALLLDQSRTTSVLRWLMSAGAFVAMVVAISLVPSSAFEIDPSHSTYAAEETAVSPQSIEDMDMLRVFGREE